MREYLNQFAEIVFSEFYDIFDFSTSKTYYDVSNINTYLKATHICIKTGWSSYTGGPHEVG